MCSSPGSWPTAWKALMSRVTPCTQVSAYTSCCFFKSLKYLCADLLVNAFLKCSGRPLPVKASCIFGLSLFPSGVICTELCRNMNQSLQLLMMPLAKLFFLDPMGGSQTTLYCSLQEGIEPLSGRYFSNCALQQVGTKGRDDGLAKKLWELSEKLTNITQQTHN